MHWVKHLSIQILIFSVVICGATIAWSQDVEKEEKQLKFPATEEEIIEGLGEDPPDSILKGRGGLRSKGNDGSLFGDQNKGSRGLAGIVDDDKALAEAPKVGALILFDFDSSTIKEESKPLLSMYGTVLQGDLADIVLIIAGHTDSKGSNPYNVALSRRRAEAVKKFLVAEYQIAESRLFIKPYGEDKPIASNETKEGRAKNRRVEFIRIQ
jgi:outer membrane protein OmpA-like peptidoglycan-associated protein